MNEVADLMTSVQAEIRRTGTAVTNVVDHAHRECEFNLVMSGSGAYDVEGERYSLSPGALVWLLPGQRHRLDRGPDLDLWVVTVAVSHLDAEILRDLATRPLVILSDEDVSDLDGLLRHVAQDASEPALYDLGIAYAFRTAWRLTVTSPPPALSAFHPAVSQVISMLATDVSLTTLADAARRCGHAENYLGRLISGQTGHNFKGLLNRFRIERFFIGFPRCKNLLTAAMDAGFGSYAQFYRTFCELVGVTPRSWVRRGAQPLILSPTPRGTSGDLSVSASTRGPWYTLCSQPFPMAMRCFGHDFAGVFESTWASKDVAPAVPSAVLDIADLRRFEPYLVDELRLFSPEKANLLASIFSRHNVFEQYKSTIGLWGLGVSDLSAIIGVDVAIAHICYERRALPSRDEILPLCLRFRRAFSKADTFSNVSADEKQRIAAAFIVCSVIRRNAARDAAVSCRKDLVDHLAVASRNVVLAMTGIDLARSNILLRKM